MIWRDSKLDSIWSLDIFDEVYSENIDPYEYFSDDIMLEHMSVLTEAQGPVKKSNILDRILEVIRKMFILIQKAFDKVVTAIKGLFVKDKPPKTIDQILVELGVITNREAKEGKYEILKNANSDNPMNVDEIELSLKPIRIAFNQDKTIEISSAEIFKEQWLGKSPVKDRFENKWSAVVGFHQFVIQLIQDDSAMERLKRVSDWIEQGGNAPQQIIDDIDYLYKKRTSLKVMTIENYKLSMGQLTKFQETINYAQSKLRNFDNIKSGVYSNITVKTLNNFAKVCNDIQFGMNLIMGSLKQIYVIDASYVNSIKDEDILSKFVEECVRMGIPSKNIALNVYLAAHTDLKGDKANPLKPVWGQTRTILFPPNQNYVIKIALNNMGLRANESEYKVWNHVKNVPEKDMFAEVFSLSSNHYIEHMEKLDAKYVIDSGSLMKFRADLRKVCQKYKIPMNMTTDMHIGNVAINPRTNQPASIDYGMSYRTAV